jgi:hypothetical protein
MCGSHEAALTSAQLPVTPPQYLLLNLHTDGGWCGVDVGICKSCNEPNNHMRILVLSCGASSHHALRTILPLDLEIIPHTWIRGVPCSPDAHRQLSVRMGSNDDMVCLTPWLAPQV